MRALRVRSGALIEHCELDRVAIAHTASDFHGIVFEDARKSEDWASSGLNPTASPASLGQT